MTGFLSFFGPVNFVKQFGDFSIIGVATVLLSPSWNSKEIPNNAGVQTRQFLANVTSQVEKEEIVPILLSHVPLYRPHEASCQIQNAPKISHHAGYSYTNLLNRETTELLLSLSPLLIFSGDNHSPCIFDHGTKEKPMLEVSFFFFCLLKIMLILS